MNAFEHVVHLYGFSPLWIRMCVFRLPMCVNAFRQILHWNGLLRVCDRTCFAKSPEKMNDLSHCVHWKTHAPGAARSSVSGGNSRRRPLPGPGAETRKSMKSINLLPAETTRFAITHAVSMVCWEQCPVSLVHCHSAASAQHLHSSKPIAFVATADSEAAAVAEVAIGAGVRW